LEANAILAVMVLAWWSLRIQHGHHGSNLTELSCEITWTLACVVIHSIHTRGSILQSVDVHMCLCVRARLAAGGRLYARHFINRNIILPYFPAYARARYLYKKDLKS
jgi:hypothetical protein